MNEITPGRRYLFVTIVAAAVVAIPALLLEGGSAVVLWAHATYFQNPQPIPDAPQDTPDTRQRGVAAALDIWRGDARGAYAFRPTLNYRLKPYVSEFVNISTDGIRATPASDAAADAAGTTKTIVWVFGSSAIFGYENADDETVPYFLQKHLTGSGTPSKVYNFGVPGYGAVQDYAHLLDRLADASLPRPDYVIFVNGANDHLRTWNLATGDGDVADPLSPLFDLSNLSYYWTMHNEGRVISGLALRRLTQRVFANTSELVQKALKYVALRTANRSAEDYYARHAERSARQSERFEGIFPARLAVYRHSMASAYFVSQSIGARFIYALQPQIACQTRSAVGTERIVLFHELIYRFAVEDDAGGRPVPVPSHRIDQEAVWNRAHYCASYLRLFDETTASLAPLERFRGELGLYGMNDLLRETDGALFGTAVHYTARGAELIGGQIAARIRASARGN